MKVLITALGAIFATSIFICWEPLAHAESAKGTIKPKTSAAAKADAPTAGKAPGQKVWPCVEDAKKLCKDRSGGFQIRQCLADQMKDLSPNCRQVVHRFKAAVAACPAEAVDTCRTPWQGHFKLYECIRARPGIPAECKKVVEPKRG